MASTRDHLKAKRMRPLSPHALRCSALLGLMLLVTLSVTPLAAQDIGELSKKQRKELIAALDKAQAAYDGGDFERARDAFKAAYVIYPDPELLYKLALCYERLGEDAKAIASYQEYIKLAPDDPERPRIEGVIRALKERSAPKLATVEITLQPAQATLYLDKGQRLEQAGPDGRRVMEISAGEHLIEVQRPGFVTQRHTINVSAAQTYTLLISLAPVAEAKPERSTTSLVGNILLGAGGLTIITSGLVLAHANGMNKVLSEQYKQRDGQARPAGFNAQEERYNSRVQTGWLLLGLGGAVAITGGALKLWQSQSEQTSVTILPTLSHSGAGLTTTLEF